MTDIKWISEDPIEPLLPKEGWLGTYVRFTSNLEACSRFRFFTACCMLGSAISNKIWIHRGDPTLLPKMFPNPWILLLAPPGRGHKTSTINMGVNALTQACPEVRILADKITPESLVKALQMPNTKEGRIRIGPSDATGLVKAPELSVFFGKQNYNQGLVSLITDLYDYRPQWSSETIMRGKAVLKHICISIIGGSTPDWLQSMIPEDAFTGGFMSRYIIVEMPPNYLRRVALPQRPDITWIEVLNGLKKVGRRKGEITWTKEGKEYYINYYESVKPSGEVQRDAYLERDCEQMLRLAMLLAVSTELEEVDKSHMVHAREILNFLMKETAPRIEKLTTHPRMALVQEIQDVLKLRGRMTKRQLMSKFYRNLPGGELQFEEALRVLKIAGKIDYDGKMGNPTYFLDKEGEK